MKLRCAECKKSYSIETGYYTCPGCDGRLEVIYDKNSEIKKESIYPGIWKYISHLPVKGKEVISLDEGNTPLLKVNRKEPEGNFLVKCETVNITGTYKDRPASVGVTKAKELGARGVIVASDGNSAPAVAAYAARAGMECLVLMPQKTPSVRYRQAAAFGARILLIDGTINDCIDLSGQICNSTGFHNCSTTTTFNPYQIEANKTIAYEIFEGMNEVPDWISVPVGGGGLLSGVVMGFKELINSNKIEKLPKILAVQASECAPFVKAFNEEKPISRWNGNCETKAITIALPYPPDGKMAMGYLKETDGFAISVQDEEIINAVDNLSSYNGILAEPSGAVSYAGALKAFRKNIIKPGQSSVSIITGTGLKSMEVFEGLDKKLYHFSNDLEEILEKLK